MLTRKGFKRELSFLNQVIQTGIKIYSELFDFEYPFEKIDFVFCPNLRYAGMESAACIIFSETSVNFEMALSQ